MCAREGGPDHLSAVFGAGSLNLLMADLRERGIVTKVRSLKTGCTVGGIAFTRGPLAHFLRNRFYIGEVLFKGEVLSWHRDLRWVAAASMPPPPRPHRGHAAGGAGSRGARGARNSHTTALFADECQSFLDNVIAGLGQIGSWKHPASAQKSSGPIRNCEDLRIRHGHGEQASSDMIRHCVR